MPNRLLHAAAAHAKIAAWTRDTPTF
jgi:hypothetical protein